MKILPSLASADQMHLGEAIRSLEGHPYLHFDVEDGNFVPNITFGLKTIRAAAAICKARMDAHLMVTNPLDYLEPLASAGFAAVAFHWESTGYPMRVLNRIHKLRMQAGIALNPCTSAEVIRPYVQTVEYVLVMTSEPDGEGDLFQPAMLDKIKSLSEMSQGRFEIIVDGGIGEKEFPLVREAGATSVVMGRTVFQSEDPISTIDKFK